MFIPLYLECEIVLQSELITWKTFFYRLHSDCLDNNLIVGLDIKLLNQASCLNINH